MKNIELLSPAGNFDCLKAAINNGADAIYLGGKNFSARAFANNFDNEELIKAIEYAHLRNVKIYVTLNTLLNEYEVENAIKMADFYYQNNVDALLIQDLGLFYVLKQKYPDFEMHCSTQMHVHNIDGIQTAKQLGFKRVVLARESDLSLIQQACKQDIEIEVFVHGAICTAYSGQCLMSSFTKDRSANKGMCAQSCRLKYDLLDKTDNKITTNTDYLISPKDMFLLQDIDKLIDAGVKSFKIEGRMKSAAYVGYVTKLYRKAIDNYLLNHQNLDITDTQMNNLKVLFNRGFTNGLLNNINDLYGQKTPNHLGIEIGEVINNKQSFTYIRLNHKLNQFDGIRIGDFGCIANMIYKDDLLVNSADKDDIIALKTDQILKGKVYKTLDYQLENSINQIEDKKLSIDLNIYIHPDEYVKVFLNSDLEFEYISDIKAQKAINKPITIDNIITQFSKLKDTIYQINKMDVDYIDSFLSISQLNEIRRKAIEAYNSYRLNSFKRTIINNNIDFIDLQDENHDNNLIMSNDNITDSIDNYSLNYVINPESVYSENKNAIISEIGGLLKEYKNKIAFASLNCCNSYTYEFYKRLGFKYITLSYELNDMMIDKLIEQYELRNNHSITPCIFTKGDIVLMYLKNNPFKDYIYDDNRYYLSDGKNRYSIKNHGKITEIILENNEISHNISHKYIKFIIK